MGDEHDLAQAHRVPVAQDAIDRDCLARERDEQFVVLRQVLPGGGGRPLLPVAPFATLDGPLSHFTGCAAERPERRECVTHLVLRRGLPRRHLERADMPLFDRDGVLKRIRSLDIIRVLRIRERPDDQEHIARSDGLLRVAEAARGVDDVDRKMILRHDLHGHEARARVWQRHGDWCGVQIEDTGRIERVAVHSHDVLIVNRRHRSTVVQRAERAALDRTAEVEIGLGPNEILHIDRNGRSHDSPVAERSEMVKTRRPPRYVVTCGATTPPAARIPGKADLTRRPVATGAQHVPGYSSRQGSDAPDMPALTGLAATGGRRRSRTASAESL